MAALFDDEVLSIVLRFSNPNKREMEDAAKLAANLSLALDNVIRRSVSAGQSVNGIFDRIRALGPVLQSLEKRSSGLNLNVNALQSAQRILDRYKPERLEKMAEFKAAQIAETSGSAALRRELGKNSDLLRRMIATNEGRYNRASRGSRIGVGMFIDTETAFDPRVRKDKQDLRQQLVELTATLFTFNKLTGEILNPMKQTYHAFQDLKHFSQNLRLPSGVTRDMLRGQGISSSVLRSMLNRSDFVVAHNAPFDKRLIEKIVPQFASAMWMDSMRGIPWRELGYRSRAQQDLLRANNILPGPTAHRSGADVAAAIRLLGTTTGGGGTFLGMMMGNQGPLNQAQQTLAIIKQGAEEIKDALKGRLGESRESFMSSTARYKPTMRDFGYTSSRGVEVISQYVIDQIEGGITARSRRPARSTDYGIKKGGGQSPETTPGLLGETAISLDRRIGVISEFLRNLTLAGSSHHSAANFLSIYQEQQAYQEKLQQSRGKGVQIKNQLRLGDEVALAAMAGTNTRLTNIREGVPSFNLLDSVFGMDDRKLAEAKANRVSRMLGQPWARGEQQFSPEQIEEFITKHIRNPHTSAIPISAQMANQVGPGNRSFLALTSILLNSQAVGRKLAEEKEIAQARLLLEAPSSGAAAFPGRRFKKLLGDERGSVPLDFFSNWFKRRSTGSSANPLSYDERARMDLPDPTSLRGSIRRDTLDKKLQKLAESVDAAEKAFEFYRDVINKRAREADRKGQLRDAELLDAMSEKNATFNAQIARLQNRRSNIGTTASRRLADLTSRFESGSTRLGLADIEAEFRLDEALIGQKRKEKKLRETDAFKEGRLTPDQVKEMTSGPVRSAQRRSIFASYQAQLSQLTDQGEIEKLRQQTASKVAFLRYGATGDPETRQKFQERVYGVLGGPTLAQTAETRQGRIMEDRTKQQAEIDSQINDVEKKRAAAREKTDKARTENARKTANSIYNLDASLEKKQEDLVKKRAAAEKKAHEARVAFIKNEDARGGGGSGTGGGGGHGRGGYSNLVSRGGLDFGLGLASLAAYDAGIKEIIKDTTLYAARTQTLQLVTDQMAKVNGLNTDEVKAEVEAVKKLNITTQEANSVVQKMMFAQLDVAKATDLARTAQDAAILANVNSSEALDRIIQGIVTGQTRMLHNMGLQVSMLSVMRELRAERRAEGKTGEPNELEKRQAMLNKVLMEGARITGTYERSMLTAGKQFNSLQREAQEAANAIGKEFLPEFGRFVSLATQGLHWIQANGEATAKFTSALAGLGAAANTLGSIAFFRWIIGAGALTPAGRVAAGVAAVGAAAVTYFSLNQDDAKALAKTAKEQQDSLKEKRVNLEKERSQLLGMDQSDPSVKNALERNLISMRSIASAEAGIQQELTSQLAEQYEKRIKDLDDYIATYEGKNGKFAAFWQQINFLDPRTMFTPQPKLERKMGTLLEADPQSVAAARKAVMEGVTPPGISPQDLLMEVQRRAAEKDRLLKLPAHIRNEERMTVQGIISDMVQSESELNKLEERLGETGAVGLRSRKSMGSPRAKALLDYEQQVSVVNKRQKELVDLKAKAAAGDEKSKKILLDVTKELGGGSFELGAAKIEKFLEKTKDILGAAKEDLGIILSKIDRQTQAEINSINAQVEAERIRVRVVKGNYESEAQGIEDLSKLEKDTADKNQKLLDNADDHKKQIAQAEANRQSALIDLENRRFEEGKARATEGLRLAAEQESEDILNAPGDAEEAVRKSFKVRLDAINDPVNGIQGENDRFRAQTQLLFELDKALKDVARDKKLLSAEGRISAFEDSTNLETEIDRIVSTRRYRRSESQRALEEIERTRKAEIAVAENRFAELQPLTPARDQQALENQRNEEIRKANSKAGVDRLRQLEQNRESSQNRLAELYNEQFQRIARINELQANSEAEEQAAARETHLMRLEYIQKEYDARDKTLEAIRQRDKEILQANFDELQRLLQLRKVEIDRIKGEAGSVFDAITSGQQGALGQLVAQQAKGIGRTIFQNLAVEYLKDIRKTIGTTIPGQVDAQGKPTRLGRILSGTVFSPGVDQKEIDRLKIAATQDNTSAERDLAEAVRQLDDDIRKLRGDKPNSAVRMPSTTPMGGPNLYDVIPLFGGTNQSNPLIFHYGAVGGSANIDLTNNTQAEKNNTNALDDLSSVLKSTSAMYSVEVYTLIQEMKRLEAALNKAATPQGKAESTITYPQDFVAGSNAKTLGDILFNGQNDGSGVVFQGAPGGGGFPGSSGAGSSGKLKSNLAKGVLAAAGTLQAIGGFKRGGARGITQGVAGTLMAVAPFTGPAAPFLMAASLGLDMISSLFGDPKENRRREIADFMNKSHFTGPVQINREFSTAGNLLSYDAFGRPRDIGIRAFPVGVQPNVFRPTSTTVDDPYPTYVDVPGRVTDPALTSGMVNPSILDTTPQPKAGGDTYITLPISAMDSKDVISRSRDIAAAVSKELRLGNEISVNVRNAVFGA